MDGLEFFFIGDEVDEHQYEGQTKDCRVRECGNLDSVHKDWELLFNFTGEGGKKCHQEFWSPDDQIAIFEPLKVHRLEVHLGAFGILIWHL